MVKQWLSDLSDLWGLVTAVVGTIVGGFLWLVGIEKRVTRLEDRARHQEEFGRRLEGKIDQILNYLLENR